MLTYVGTLHTCRRLSLNETATAFQADRVAFCKQTDFNGGPYRPLHDGGVGAGSQPTSTRCFLAEMILLSAPSGIRAHAQHATLSTGRHGHFKTSEFRRDRNAKYAIVTRRPIHSYSPNRERSPITFPEGYNEVSR